VILTGTGKFGAPVNFTVGINPTLLITADFNNDGRADLVAANFGSNDVSVLIGDGASDFYAASNIRVGPATLSSSPTSVAAADFNGDGKTDIAVTDRSRNKLIVMLGTGTGGFGPSVEHDVFPTSVVASDFNHDGKADLNQ
jgi:hypothetical protein